MTEFITGLILGVCLEFFVAECCRWSRCIVSAVKTQCIKSDRGR